jgi:hypothetical protein
MEVGKAAFDHFLRVRAAHEEAMKDARERATEAEAPIESN